MRGFAAPGTHLLLQRVPADMVSCWHAIKLDCGKHHHAETDKMKKIAVAMAEERLKIFCK